MEREAAEEMSAAVGPGKSKAVLTGFARFVDRGGKPEFFGIVRTASKIRDLGPMRGERYVDGIYSLEVSPTPQGLIKASTSCSGSGTRWIIRIALR